MSYIRATSQSYTWRQYIRQSGVILWDNRVYKSYAGTKSGTSVPHWRGKIRAGSDASSSYARDDYSLEKSEGFASWQGHSLPTSGGYVGSYYGVFQGNLSTVPDFMSHLTTSLAKADAAALKQVYDKLAQERAHTNSLQTLGELGETIRMLRHPFRAIADLTQSHINRLVKSKRGLRGTEQQRFNKYYELVRSTYLEYVFGIAPLIAETKSIAETVARWNLEAEGIKQARKRIVGRGVDVNVTNSQGVQYYAPAGLTVFAYNRHTIKRTERRVQYICGLASTKTADAASTDRLLELLGFDFRNFVPTVWEVIPWSWLADYVANINDIIDAAVADTSNVLWTVKTVTEVTTLTDTTPCVPSEMTARLKLYGIYGSGSGDMGTMSLRRTSMTRYTGVSLGIPALVFTIPVNASQYANAYAAIFSMRPASAFRLKNPY